MGEIRSYQDLDAWKLAMRLARTVYEVTKGFPGDERFGLTSQLRRASVSIPSNIAEGWGRGSTNDYARFLRMARGSVYEVETQLIIARDLGYVDDEALHRAIEHANEAGRVLAGLTKSIESKLAQQG